MMIIVNIGFCYGVLDAMLFLGGWYVIAVG